MNIKAKSCLDTFLEMTTFVRSPENALQGEDSLRALGLGNAYVAKLDAVGAFIQEAPTLRNSPKKAPSTFLADRLEDLMNFVAQGLKSRGEVSSAALHEFHVFREKIPDYSREGLSHHDWVYLNYHLARGVTPPDRARRRGLPDHPFSHERAVGGWDLWDIPLSHEAISKRFLKHIMAHLSDESNLHHSYNTIRKKFPEYIMASVPGDLGVISFNRSFLTGVTPYSLLNGCKGCDGPLSYHIHDGLHFLLVETALRGLNTLEFEALARFHRHFLLSTRTLAGRKRQMVELVYFTLWHEARSISSFIEFAKILNKHPDNPKTVEKFILDIINKSHVRSYWIEENFSIVYKDAVNHMAHLIVESGE